ncbi:MAG: hypothetical protein AAF717_06835 [Bacteroidota bacterium]
MDKLEKHIRKKFKEREITPSTGVWERIDNALGEEQPSRTRSPFFWAMGIAASLLIVAILSIRYWNAGEKQPIEVKLVEGAAKNGTLIEEKQPVTSLGQEKKEDSMLRTENSTFVVKEEQSDRKKDKHLPEMLQEDVTVAEKMLESGNSQLQEVTTTERVIDMQIEDKLNEVLAQVNAMEDNEIAVTDAEIDSLLLAAQQELLVEGVIRENGTVDALALLNEVEEELDQTFRDQLFDTLKEGFFKLRTAVADRNN